jgi:hypothetical protein
MTFLAEAPFPGLGPCPHCFESSGYAARWNPHTWDEPGWCDADPTRPCPVCEGTGSVEMEDATDDELFWFFDDAFDALTAA